MEVVCSYFRKDRTNFQGAQRFYGEYAKAEFWISAMGENLSSTAGGGGGDVIVILFPKFLYFHFIQNF